MLMGSGLPRSPLSSLEPTTARLRRFTCHETGTVASRAVGAILPGWTRPGSGAARRVAGVRSVPGCRPPRALACVSVGSAPLRLAIKMAGVTARPAPADTAVCAAPSRHVGTASGRRHTTEPTAPQPRRNSAGVKYRKHAWHGPEEETLVKLWCNSGSSGLCRFDGILKCCIVAHRVASDFMWGGGEVRAAGDPLPLFPPPPLSATGATR